MGKVFNKIPLLLSIIFFSCTAQKNTSLGAKINENLPSTSKLLIPSGALVDAVTCLHNKSSFIIGLNKDKTVVYVSTVDPNFEVDGFRIDDEISKIFNASKINYTTGWGYYIQLDSEWYAGFDINSKITEHSKIQWFFKYKFVEGSKDLFKK